MRGFPSSTERAGISRRRQDRPALGRLHRAGDLVNSATSATAWTASPSAPTAVGSRQLASIARSGSGIPTTGRPVAAFHGHAAPVFSVTFSPDGKKLASASQDATVKVWDLTSEPGVHLLSLEPRKARSHSRSDRAGLAGWRFVPMDSNWPQGELTRRWRSGTWPWPRPIGTHRAAGVR